ncbi:hypothetical protein [Sphingomonas sp.]|uniref:hypothetical protein n=1 Tax=Sphingomonas sp. TaxID=28214 RepID=UPI0031CEC60D
MRATDPRLWFIALALGATGAAGFVNARYLRTNYDSVAVNYRGEIEHVRKAIARVPGPRLIIAGGSSTLFGLDAAAVERELGVPAVNAGMPSMLGSEDVYNEFLASLVRPGDLVVYSNSHWMAPSTQRQSRDEAVDAARIADRLSRMGPIEFSLRGEAAWPTFLFLPHRALIGQVADPHPHVPLDWQRDANASAVACKLNLRNRVPLDAPESMPPESMFARSREVVQSVKARGGDTVLAESWTLIHERERGHWQPYRHLLVRGLARIAPVVGAPEPLALNAVVKDFCDSPLHLTSAGRKVRTDHLIAAFRTDPALREKLDRLRERRR